MKDIAYLLVDFQKEFTRPEGKGYVDRPCHNWLRNDFFPLFDKDYEGKTDFNYNLYEIISDYRQPRPGDSGDMCYPGTTGYESDLPEKYRSGEQWVKAMNGPTWIRDNIGTTDPPGEPYQDPDKFECWVRNNIGEREDIHIKIVGLTLGCCVLCVTQQLCFMGYDISIVKEGVDCWNGNQVHKKFILENLIDNWAVSF